MTVSDLTKQGAWAPSEYKDCLSRYGISMFKIRRSRDGLIFNRWIPVLVRLYWDGPQGVNEICTQCSVFRAFCYTHTDANILHTICLLIKFQTYIYHLDLKFNKWYHSTNTKLNKLNVPCWVCQPNLVSVSGIVVLLVCSVHGDVPVVQGPRPVKVKISD